MKKKRREERKLARKKVPKHEDEDASESEESQSEDETEIKADTSQIEKKTSHATSSKSGSKCVIA